MRLNRHWANMRGSTEVPRPVRGDGAGPVRGCGARRPARPSAYHSRGCNGGGRGSDLERRPATEGIVRSR